jgi:hypothetical protein
MQYQQIGQGSQYPYPNHAIDPAKKDKKWGMQYAKAAYYDWSFVYPKGIFANNGGDYEKFKLYALGKQPISIYKKMLIENEDANSTWMSVDWTVRPIIAAYRDKVISRLMDAPYGIVATPIDITAKTEATEYYNKMKVLLTAREAMMQQNPELANHPMLALQKGDPMDIEELEMRVEQGEQFNRSKDAELAIAVGMYENGVEAYRRRQAENNFDLGVTGYKEWLGDDNKSKFRDVVPDNVVTSYCKKGDFSDMVHAGELIDVPLVELATLYDEEGNRVFDEKMLQEFASSICGKWDNPTNMGASSGRPYDKFKCKVLDMEFYSYNDMVYRDAPDANGNTDFRKAEYGRGKKSEKYKRKCIQVVYKVKWIIGTDHCYDFGLMTDMKRAADPKKKAKTSLSYKFFAYNFHEMKAQGFMERLIPYIDEYQLTILKIQNFKNRAVPSGWWIDLDALENVALNKGGKNMEPKELLQMFFETGALVGRSKDAAGVPYGPNWKPIIPIENTAASELAMFYADLVNIFAAMDKITGLNDVTTGQPKEKLLTAGYETSEMSTNHSIAPMRFAEKHLTQQLAGDVLLRMQQGVRRGGISGYAPALNTNLLKFMEISPDIAHRDYGIMLEEKTSNEEKQWLYQMMLPDIQNGFLDVSDAVYIINAFNAKQAQMIWAHRVKKAKELAHQRQMQLVDQQAKGNQAAALAQEQAKQKTMMLEVQVELQKKKLEGQIELAKQKMELEMTMPLKMRELELKYRMNQENNQTDLQEASIAARAKVIAQEKSSEGDIIKTEVAGAQAIEKQKIANQKPQPKSSSSKK